MKNVAATSGQSVSLATLFFTVGITREGSCVGTDIELNFYSRPPKGNSLSPLRLTVTPRNDASSHSQNTRVAPACKEKMHRSGIFFCLANRSSAPHDLKGESVWMRMKPIPDQRRPTGSECSLRELQDKQGKLKR